ncbi:methyltransferase type 11 [Pseudomonas sp. M47T1]|uniref:class I SAM-dependent methyltransferase n=1 Tax=unclassified Pseudomonas TaxID=196821 RepID=UPI0002606708|nr:class I SAM-dependent methyltransferase [Pseudomonas sp. M47T1]EIK98231.1 methyltransferase type 11 [Pseudomonas sp. M47T1]
MPLPPSSSAERELSQAPAGPLCDSLGARLAYWREAQLVRHSLHSAGEPGLVLDLPCGAGRFWPVLAERANRVILAADRDAERLGQAMGGFAPALAARVTPLEAWVDAITLGSNAVDCIFCMRLFHRVADSEQRLGILREFHRVSRDTVIISLWVDGNYRAWRRRRTEQRRPGKDRQNRFVVARTQIEGEFRQAGFEIVDHHDLVPGYAMWRTYVLRKG